MSLSLELVRRIQAGDCEAFADLYRRYRDRLLLTIRLRLGAGLRARLESEDVLQSVVRQAMQDLQGFEPREDGSLEHWLHVCVLNKIRGLAAWHGAQKRAGDEPLTDTLASDLAAAAPPDYVESERYARLERELARLPEPMREVILLRRIEGLGNAEAARRLGRSEAATAQLHARAMARLAGRLRMEHGDG
ncbi:MAG: sigma-70 family RNA polymerase sigma factor [Planctomycetes bacterium]|nr:sigma-70 family RNA polymerase sigma factor [Planctomycetota bacterium]